MNHAGLQDPRLWARAAIRREVIERDGLGPLLTNPRLVLYFTVLYCTVLYCNADQPQARPRHRPRPQLPGPHAGEQEEPRRGNAEVQEDLDEVCQPGPWHVLTMSPLARYCHLTRDQLEAVLRALASVQRISTLSLDSVPLAEVSVETSASVLVMSL